MNSWEVRFYFSHHFILRSWTTHREQSSFSLSKGRNLNTRDPCKRRICQTFIATVREENWETGQQEWRGKNEHCIFYMIFIFVPCDSFIVFVYYSQFIRCLCMYHGIFFCSFIYSFIHWEFSECLLFATSQTQEQEITGINCCQRTQSDSAVGYVGI